MASSQTSKSAAVRARLNHPVIDSDGHTVEFFPAVLDYLKQIGGAKIAERYQSGGFGGSFFGWYRLSPEERRDRSREDGVDDWAPCRIERVEDIRDLFVPNFYFGCEADDPMNAWAFNRQVNPFGVQLKAIFSSDIGHWEVPDMTEVVEEAHELVEERVITEEDFRDFVFTNPATLWTDMNPDFFKGTAVEDQVNKLLGQKNNR